MKNQSNQPLGRESNSVKPILLCYQLEDGRAESLADCLLQKLGTQRIKVVTTAQSKLLLSAVNSCDLLVLIVGKELAASIRSEMVNWNSDGLPTPQQPALQAVHTMLLRPAPLIVATVGGANLQRLHWHINPVEISTSTWDEDCVGLANTIEANWASSKYWSNGGAESPQHWESVDAVGSQWNVQKMGGESERHSDLANTALRSGSTQPTSSDLAMGVAYPSTRTNEAHTIAGSTKKVTESIEKDRSNRRRGKPDQQQPDQQQQQQQQMAMPVPATLRRTPHLDLVPEGAVAPGTIIKVRVYADKQAAHVDEETEDIVIELPPHIERINLNAHLLVSPQLEAIGSVIQPLTIEVNKDSSSVATFEVQVRSKVQILESLEDLPSARRASISAVFNYLGRPSGSVTRIIELDLDFAVPPDAPNVKERVAAGTLRVDAEAKSPDLILQVRAQPINDGRQFQCWVSTPLIDAEEKEQWIDWNLPDVADSIVRGYMEDFVKEDATALERLSSLKGSGRQLFDAAPDNFKRVYWKLVDAGHPPKTIAVVSDEPYIPWELMIPHRRKQRETEIRKPLGVEAAVGRWLLGDGCSAPQHLPLSNSIVIAPTYKGKDALEHADDEAEYVLTHFPGIRIQPVKLETIDLVLSSERTSLLHLICHGVDPAESPSQAVYLDEGRKLDTTMLSGLDSIREALESQLTLVVINACEVGRPKPALVGLGGFAQTFIDLGAAGVVAALWSVRDDLAHEVTMAFYEEILKNRERSFAEVLREIRARSYDKATGAEDTYAAYCFYGDPLACAAP